MIVYRPIKRIFTLAAIISINLPFLRAQQPELRSILGFQTEWKGMDLGLFNMNFFSSEEKWFQNNTRLTADFKSNNNFRFGLGYQYEYLELKNRIQHENRPMLFLHYLKKWDNWDLGSLSTMEFRFIDGILQNRYKNELGFHFTQWDIAQPFILTMASINIDKMQYAGQRTTVAVKVPIDTFNLIFFSFYEISRRSQSMWNSKLAIGIIGICKFSNWH